MDTSPTITTSDAVLLLLAAVTPRSATTDDREVFGAVLATLSEIARVSPRVAKSLVEIAAERGADVDALAQMSASTELAGILPKEGGAL